MISKVVTKTGAKVQALGMLYKAVVHNVLLCGSDSWVVKIAVLKVMEGFQHRASRRIAGMTDRRAEDGEWDYSLVADEMEAALLWMINKYIQILQSTISAQVACRKNMSCAPGRNRCRDLVGW